MTNFITRILVLGLLLKACYCIDEWVLFGLIFLGIFVKIFWKISVVWEHFSFRYFWLRGEEFFGRVWKILCNNYFIKCFSKFYVENCKYFRSSILCSSQFEPLLSFEHRWTFFETNGASKNLLQIFAFTIATAQGNQILVTEESSCGIRNISF